MTVEPNRGWRSSALLLGVAALLGWTASVAADPITLDARFVRQDGSPIAGMEVRMVVGSEPGSRSAGSGKRLRTGADGRVAYDVDAVVQKRRVALDNIFVRHPARTIEVGIEMDLVGRRALYWIELDLVRDGTVGGMTAFVQGAGGSFDRQLKFHGPTHSFSFPDDPDGMLMSDIGAALRHHEMTGTDGGPWRVDLTVEKQEFTVR